MRFYRPITPIKAMTFDLDDTLYDNAPVIKKADEALNIFLNKYYPETAKLSKKEWFVIKSKLIEQNPALASDMGQLRLLSLQVALSREVSKDKLEAAAQACFDCFYSARSDFTIHREIAQILSQLSKRIPLVAITNGNVDPEKIGIVKYFSHHLHASVKRPMKPHRAMFDEAAALLNAPPSSLLHVGDNLIKDVYGATQAGFQTAWYACNRSMDLNREPVRVLPSVELHSLNELVYLV